MKVTLKRKVVKIDEEKCNGCGICVPACAEGALKIVDGKARLVSEIFCDGLGACLGECPQGAITIEEREAETFDKEAVEEHIKLEVINSANEKPDLACGCPGSAVKTFSRDTNSFEEPAKLSSSQLEHWPVQLMLVPPFAPFLKGADIVICADCVPFAFADFHRVYIKNRSVLVGCPKLDDLAFYRRKLADIFREAQPASITVLRMEVPCCGGIAQASLEARNEVIPDCPVEIHTVGIKGNVTKENFPALVQQ